MMTSLFSATGRRSLDQFIRPGLLCAFDFDGTLAPVVTEPSKAQTPANIISRMNELAKYAKIAVITGRSVADLNERLGFVPDYVVGNHGLEGVPGWDAPSQHYRDQCTAWADRLDHYLQDAASFDPAIWVEQKEYSLSVHYRLARDRERAEAVLIELFRRELPDARVVGGKYVFNLLPDGTQNKGSALETLIVLSQSHGALYVGDDVTDEDVFCLRHPAIFSVRIGHNPHSSANFFLPHRLCMLQLLDEMLDRFKYARQFSKELLAT